MQKCIGPIKVLEASRNAVVIDEDKILNSKSTGRVNPIMGNNGNIPPATSNNQDYMPTNNVDGISDGIRSTRNNEYKDNSQCVGHGKQAHCEEIYWAKQSNYTINGKSGKPTN